MTAFFLTLPAADDLLLLAVIFTLLTLSALVGQSVSQTMAEEQTGGAVVLTGATLTLSGLLTGFVFSVALGGWAAREHAEVGEAMAIARAAEYVSLLPGTSGEEVAPLLRRYLDVRIRFYREQTPAGSRGWLHMAGDVQRRLWDRVSRAALREPGPLMPPVLSAFGALMASRQQAVAVWQRQIPDAAWAVLLLFAMSACFLVGHHPARGGRRNVYVLLLPGLTAVTLFMMAEIDLPGEGMIRVMPDDLEHLTLTAGILQEGQTLQHPVTHVRGTQAAVIP